MSPAPRQHTPGPWSVDSDRAHNNLVVTCDDTGNAVAEVLSEQGDDPEAKANARLIASAPDLLAALEVLIADAAGPFSDSHSPYFSVTPSTLANARAAIARATTGGNAS